MDSLLPPNASDGEKQLDTVTSSAFDLPVPNRSLWDANNCPVHMLPWLAWALSVDYWNSDWPETVKREVIASSIAVHRSKGTVQAVKTAIASIGVDVELQEWFDNGLNPHTFNVTAWSNDNIDDNGQPKLTKQAFTDIVRSIDNVKPVRSHFALAFGSKVNLTPMVSFTIVPKITICGLIEICVP